MQVVVDIGSWTIDIIPIFDGRPDETKANTITEGLIPCMRRINKQCMRLYNEKIEEELGETPTVVATGGLSKEIIAHCKKNIIYSENLLLDGLRAIYEKNN